MHVADILWAFKTLSQEPKCNEHEGRQRAGFKRRAQQVLIAKDHRRRQKVIHRGSKRATVQAGKRLVT
jgi:hypothetical protein